MWNENNKDNEDISSVMKDGDGHMINLSNSSIIAINHCVKMIPENNTKILVSCLEKYKPKKNLFLQRVITDNANQKAFRLITDGSDNNNKPLKTIMSGIYKNTLKSNRLQNEAIMSLNNIHSIINQTAKKSINFKKKAQTALSSPLATNRWKQSDYSSNNVIKTSNQMQSKKRQMLIGLYKHKMEFEDELDKYRNEFETSRKKKLFSTEHNQINNQLIQSNYLSMNIAKAKTMRKGYTITSPRNSFT